VKSRCESRAVATVALRYDLREVLIRDLLEERDPNLLDLCRIHAEKLTAPFGWQLRDERAPQAGQPREVIAVPEAEPALSTE
jgi:hypothetical protein